MESAVQKVKSFFSFFLALIKSAIVKLNNHLDLYSVFFIVGTLSLFLGNKHGKKRHQI